MDQGFKFIEGYEGRYSINQQGVVLRHCKKWDKKIGPAIDSSGYPYVALSKERKKKNFLLHRLVAIYFIDNPLNFPIVDHIDHNKLNFSIGNLEWCTQKHNVNHSIACNRRRKIWNRKPNKLATTVGRKLNIDQVKEIKILLNNGLGGNAISKIFNVSQTCISKIKLNKLWKTRIN